MRRTKDCPECRLTAHRAKCAFCRGRGTIPLCPPVGEPVVYLPGGEALQPMTIVSSERIAGEDGLACVRVSGWVLCKHPAGNVTPVLLEKVLGPSSTKPGHWNWRGEPS